MSDAEGALDASELTFLQSHSGTIETREGELEADELAFLQNDSIEQRAARMNAIIDQVESSMPPVPDETIPKVLHWLYYSCMCCLYYALKGEDFDWTPQLSDADDLIREKAFGLYFDRMFRIFMVFADDLDNNFYNMISERIYAHLGRQTRHPIFTYMERLSLHKELHSRRVKADPCLPRTKNEPVGASAINIVTQESYTSQHPRNHEQTNDDEVPTSSTPWRKTDKEIQELRNSNSTNHRSSWKVLIINPLPSDTDENAVDPVERTQDQELLHAVDVVHKEKRDLDPYGVFVTDDWDKLLRTIHGVCHLQLYVQDRMCEAVTEDQLKEMQGMPWEQAWKYLAGKHAHKTITELSGNKKALPPVIVNLMELRDFVQFVVSFK